MNEYPIYDEIIWQCALTMKGYELYDNVDNVDLDNSWWYSWISKASGFNPSQCGCFPNVTLKPWFPWKYLNFADRLGSPIRILHLSVLLCPLDTLGPRVQGVKPWRSWGASSKNGRYPALTKSRSVWQLEASKNTPVIVPIREGFFGGGHLRSPWWIFTQDWS